METSFLSCNNSLPQIPDQAISSKQSHFTKRSPKTISFTDHNLNTLSKNGQLKEAVIALDTIAKTGNKISSDTYISLLQSCIDFNSIEQGRKIHTQIHLVNDPNPFVETKLVSMYAKCGSLEDARQVFDEMSERNLFTWSAMIGGYTREQRWREIIKLFVLMMWEGIVPDEFLLPKVLQACGNVGDIRIGKLVHCLVIREGMNSSVHVNNALVSMYAKCGELGDARRCFENVEIRNTVTWNAIISAYCHCGENEEALRLFDQMQREGLEPGLITWNILISSYIQLGNCDLAVGIMKKMDKEGISPDVFTWTSMISGCAQSNRPEQALDFFRQMVLSGVEPNGVTIASGVSVCASLKTLKQGMELHSVGIKLGSMGDVLLGNSLIEMYSKCGNLEAARGIFDAMFEKDVVTWNSMIGGYTQAGYFSKAYDLFTRMQNSSIKPNVITWNVMISGYIQKGDEDQAMDLFKRMEMDGIIKRNAASWNSLISGFLQNGQTSKAFRVFRQMQSCSTLPNSITMLSILPACANLVESKKIKEIHGSIVRGRIELEISVANKLIDAYAKSGYMHYARGIFEDLPSRDVISWNIIISAYVLHGRPSIALELFQRMKLVGPRPNRGTFASIIMAYSLAGMVDEGNNAFSSMSTDYQISLGSEHYSAMVDLLGRAYRLGEAANFIEEMGIEEDSAVWDALLTASRVHGNLGLAVRAAERLFEVEPKNSNVYRLLLQLYALSGQSEEALKLIKPKRRGATDNSTGSSSFENKNKVHIIMTGDRSVENSDSIYSQLATIREEIEIMHFDCSETQLCISEEEKEEICGVHSEKLAILSALISTPCSSQSIRIIKNFRMCIDCHNTAKFISLKYGRDIYLYDNKCFHHFENGQCSCKDYW